MISFLFYPSVLALLARSTILRESTLTFVFLGWKLSCDFAQLGSSLIYGTERAIPLTTSAVLNYEGLRKSAFLRYSNPGFKKVKWFKRCFLGCRWETRFHYLRTLRLLRDFVKFVKSQEI